MLHYKEAWLKWRGMKNCEQINSLSHLKCRKQQNNMTKYIYFKENTMIIKHLCSSNRKLLQSVVDSSFLGLKHMQFL